MSLKSFDKLGALPDAMMAVVLGLGIWGFYGFAYLAPVAVGCVALGCIGAFAWNRSRREDG